MPTHTTPRHSRGRGSRDRSGLAREPFAAGIFLAENPNVAKRGAHWRETFAVRQLERNVASADALRNPDASSEPLTVRYPARDRIGRRNPRQSPTPTHSGRPL